MSERLGLGPDMLDRAAEALAGETPGLHEARKREVAERVIRAAFEGVPLVNYGVGLALSADNVEKVALVGRDSVMLLEQTPGDPDSFDALPHETRINYRYGKLDEVLIRKIDRED